MKKIVENSVEEQIEIKISAEIIHPLSVLFDFPFTQQYMMHFHVQDYLHYCALILSVF
jgi:hypothetical protein